MKLGKFSECKVVAGLDGIDRVIENITIMEVPDIVRWLKKKELILTSLFAIKDDLDAQDVLIQKLYYAGATALAIKPFESMEGIPSTIINSANKLGFPVIEIPSHVKYLDILSPVMHYIFDEKVILQEDIEQATNMLYEISLNSQGLDAFIENVSAITRNIVTIESEWMFIKNPKLQQAISSLTAEEKHELSILKRPIKYQREYDGEVVSCIVAPIIVDQEYYGNITSWAVKQDHIPLDIAVLETASSLISLEFLRLKVKFDIEQQYRSDFIRDLLFNQDMTEKDLVELGSRYDTKSSGDYICLIVDILKEESIKIDLAQWKEEAIVALQKIWPDILIGTIRGKVCVIHQINNNQKNKLQETIEKIHDVFQSSLDKKVFVYIGAGEIYQGLEGIRKSFYQAERAIRLFYVNKTLEPIIYFERLGTYRLLEPLIETEVLSDFYKNSIQKLIDYDEKGDLIYTLQVYFNENEVLNISSEKLYIHVNTLKYRMKKIEEITGLSFRRTEDKLTLFLGLKIHDLIS